MSTRIGRGLQHVVGSEVRDGEWRLVFLFFVNLFLLLTAYYILKVIREPLILMGGGAGKLHGGRHLVYKDQPGMANLLFTLMDKLEVPVDHIGGSTGKLEIDTIGLV